MRFILEYLLDEFLRNEVPKNSDVDTLLKAWWGAPDTLRGFGGCIDELVGQYEATDEVLVASKSMDCLEVYNHLFRAIMSVKADKDKRKEIVKTLKKKIKPLVENYPFIAQAPIDRAGIEYSDQRESGHTLVDFAVHEGDRELPINVKNAGTRFERAEQLVGLNPDDCLPIPAYKAHAALEMVPNLVYVISVDYGLVDNLGNLLPRIFNHEERIVWRLLNSYSGTRVRRAEDAFIFSTVRKYWENLKGIAQDNPFHVISARKAVRILNTQPGRTPGIGIRAWGTGARAELNVHVSIKEDTTPWSVVRERIKVKGVDDIIAAVNRKRVEEVYDPEI